MPFSRRSAFVACLLLAGCSGGAADRQDVERFEAQVTLPAGAASLEQYGRYYPPVRGYRVDELPFTTVDAEALPFAMGQISESASPERESPPLGVAVFVLPMDGETIRPGRRFVGMGDIPRTFHRGCSVVNATFDPDTGRTLSLWCNVP